MSWVMSLPMVTAVLAPPLTCPKDDRPWLWALSSPVSTSQLSALGGRRAAWPPRPAHVAGAPERKGTGPTAPSPGCGLPGATHQGVLQLCVRVRYRMPRW